MILNRHGRRLAALVQILAILVSAGGRGAAIAQSAADGGWRTFRDPKLDFAFAYPAGWAARAGCHDSRACVAVSKDRQQSADHYTVALQAFAGGLDRIATDKAGFQNGPNGWMAGRFAGQPAKHIAGDGWHGLEAVVSCGISDTSGVHSAAGDCLWAVLSNGRKSVVIDTQGTVPIDDTIRRIVESVRFSN